MPRYPLFYSEIERAADEFAIFAEEFGGPGFYQPDTARFPTPDFDEVATRFGHLTGCRQIELPADEEHMSVLGQYPGLRVMAGVVLQKTGRTIGLCMPGIVLSGQAETRIGILCAPDDKLVNRKDLAHSLQYPLPMYLHPLLYQIYGMHRKTVGEHMFGDSVNFGDVAHAALVAISSDRDDIHSKTHLYIKQGLAKTVADNGALDVHEAGSIRTVREDTIKATDASRIIISREHQVPPEDTFQAMGVGMVAIGVILSAVRSKGEGYLQPDLKLNFDAMRNQPG